MTVRSLTVTLIAMSASAIAVAPASAQAVKPEVLRTLKDCSKLVQDGKLRCGKLDVPIDRANPALGTTRVRFAYRPPERRPARHISVVADGPWVATTKSTDFLLYAATAGFAQTKRRAVILVDSRLSGENRIDCPLLQKPGNDLAVAVSECVARVGPIIDHLTYGDHADDVEDVRRHLLGEEGMKIDLFATGHATPLAEAYAVRHGRHLRSLTLDSATDHSLWPIEDLADGVAITRRICRRSPLCSASIRDPEDEIAWLARRLRKAPVTGVGYDPAGKPHRQSVDEADLAGWILLDQNGPDRDQAELPAAARALRHGDAMPLLRIAARAGVHDVDWTRTLGFEPGDTPAAWVAARCSEWPLPFNQSASPSVRRQQARDALFALPQDAFGPFTREAILPAWPIAECYEWPASPRSNPILPPSAAYWDGPTLVLAGDLNPIHGPTLAGKVAARYPHGTFVSIPNAGQAAVGWGECGPRILDTFLKSLKPGRTRCAKHELAVFPGVGALPRSVAGYPPALKASGADHSSARDRRVVAAAVHTWRDAAAEGTFSDVTSGRGLRGGAWSVEWGEEEAVFKLRRARLVRDVAVNGRIKFAYGPTNPPAVLRVRGRGTDRGRIRMGRHALWGPSRSTIRVTGRLGGRALDLRVAIH